MTSCSIVSIMWLTWASFYAYFTWIIKRHCQPFITKYTLMPRDGNIFKLNHNESVIQWCPHIIPNVLCYIADYPSCKAVRLPSWYQQSPSYPSVEIAQHRWMVSVNHFKLFSYSNVSRRQIPNFPIFWKFWNVITLSGISTNMPDIGLILIGHKVIRFWILRILREERLFFIIKPTLSCCPYSTYLVLRWMYEIRWTFCTSGSHFKKYHTCIF